MSLRVAWFGRSAPLRQSALTAMSLKPSWLHRQVRKCDTASQYGHLLAWHGGNVQQLRIKFL
jgi:hypothetical protein